MLLGSLLALGGGTIEQARAINQAMVAGAASLLVVVHSRVAGSVGFAALSALLLVSPPVILSANEVRMESVLVLL
ncbi:MAG TPA: hypothetical protein VGD62_02965 [Acidobacteriaceae bacterium]